MRAVVLRSHGGPEVLTIEEVDDPTPGRDDIIVDVEHTAVNRADILQRMGMYPDPRRRSLEIPGLEYAGVVSAVGADVTGWSVGDRAMGIEAGGCYAEKVVTHARQALPVPDSIAAVDAAAVPEVFLTAWDALVVQGGLTSGRWALVHAGASGVGTAGIQIAKAIGARIASRARPARSTPAVSWVPTWYSNGAPPTGSPHCRSRCRAASTSCST
jgi:NADPH:quinone reductase-like Zn-dependent oxidoreductase